MVAMIRSTSKSTSSALATTTGSGQPEQLRMVQGLGCLQRSVSGVRSYVEARRSAGHGLGRLKLTGMESLTRAAGEARKYWRIDFRGFSTTASSVAQGDTMGQSSCICATTESASTPPIFGLGSNLTTSRTWTKRVGGSTTRTSERNITTLGSQRSKSATFDRLKRPTQSSAENLSVHDRLLDSSVGALSGSTWSN